MEDNKYIQMTYKRNKKKNSIHIEIIMITVHIPEWWQDLPSFHVEVDPQRTHVGVGDAGGSAFPHAGEWAALNDGQAGGPWRNRDAAMPVRQNKGDYNNLSVKDVKLWNCRNPTCFGFSDGHPSFGFSASHRHTFDKLNIECEMKLHNLTQV